MSVEANATSKTVIRIKGARRDTSLGENIAKDSNVKLKCADCTHYKGTPHPLYGQSCHDLAVRPGATAPQCYTANVSVFRQIGPDTVKTLAGLIAVMTPQMQRVMMGLFRQGASLEKQGLSFFQTVYFAVGQGDALEDYYKGWAVGIGHDKMIQIVGSNYLEGGKNAMVATLSRDSLITFKQFKKRKEQLIARGLLQHLPSRKLNKVVKEDYEPPTLDSSPEMLEKQALKMRKGKESVAPKTSDWVIDQERDEL